MTPRFPRRRLAAALAAAGLALAACTTNPATGEQDFTPFMSPAQELAIGRQEHPKVLADFGGAYDERPALARYVGELGRRLQAVSEVPEPPFTFTVLNSDDVNAFALPGYVYVTRGLLALANSEAELAGVIAHEIGHITARHTAQRYNQSIFAQIAAAALGTAAGSDAIGQLAQVGAALYVQGYSREQEHQADELGVRYLSRAGYDPMAMASFLEQLEAESALAAKIAGREGVEPTAGLFSSHPRTVDRVARTAAEARGKEGAGSFRGHDVYLFHLDGMLYGDDPAQGIRRGRSFAHPTLGFRFEVPPGFRMINSPEAVVAAHPSGAAVRFDAGRLAPGLDMARYLVDDWMRGVPLGDVERITVNGMAAATGTARARTSEGPRDVRAVAVRFDRDTAYRFLILTPPRATAALSEGLRRMTYSFRRLGADERAALKPLRVRIHEVAPGDTVESLAAALPFDDLEVERFRVLNGLGPGESPAPGSLIKLISE